MLIALFKLVVLTVQEYLRRVFGATTRRPFAPLRLPPFTFWLPPVFAQTYCARRMEALAVRLTRMGQKISTFLGYVRAGHFKDAIDADVSFRAALVELKEDMRMLRCQLAAWQSERQSEVIVVRLELALARLSKISEEVFAAADQLLWEIAEHDRVDQRISGHA